MLMASRRSTPQYLRIRSVFAAFQPELSFGSGDHRRSDEHFDAFRASALIASREAN
jgi:hypothetical protein